MGSATSYASQCRWWRYFLRYHDESSLYRHPDYGAVCLENILVAGLSHRLLSCKSEPISALFVVIDEAQVAANKIRFSQGESRDVHPLLHAIYRFFRAIDISFQGIIISGTELSTEMVREAVGMLRSRSWHHRIFSDTGLFELGRRNAYGIRRPILLRTAG
jgi:hypothetical protein